MSSEEIMMQHKMSDSIRFLAVDMVQQANSGHPGMPMGLADIMTVLSRHLKHNPKNPKWLNRDRLIFSGGHGSALIYSLLHLWGYDVSMDDIKAFRQLGSKTPGHPEYGHTPGVEATTGPLGHGFAMAVGLSMASQHAAHLLNSETAKVIDHKVWCMCGDGDMQEGVAQEAASMAGHLKLANLVVIYDSNDITIEGDLNVSFSENVQLRYEAMGWRVFEMDGHDFDAIEATLAAAKIECGKPTLIIAKTKIAKGAATKEGDHNTHGAPLGADEIKASKEKAGWTQEPFFVPEDVLIRFRCAIEKGDLEERSWKKLLTELPDREKNEILELLIQRDFSKVQFPTYEAGAKVATRDSNGKILNAMAKGVAGFVGGSADLAPSNKTELVGMGDFPSGKNIRFGIREHAMGAIANSFALYGLFTPFCATFFVFSDFLKPALRLSALMKLQVFYIFTHDSIGVGEDGPTHQPIEQLSTLRAVPNLYVFRPADAEENVACWKSALELKNSPSAFVLSRQALSVLDKSAAVGDASKGGYLLKSSAGAKLSIMATGSEVEIAVKAAELLAGQGVEANVASIPCFELFASQDKNYIDSIVNPAHKVLAVEAASGLEWYRFADDVLCMSCFGESGKDKELFSHFGFTAENIAARAKAIL